MFFTKVAKLLAHLLFWLSLLRIGMGLFVAFGAETMRDNEVFSARYLAVPNSGAAIDQGTKLLLIAVALGVLAEIATHVARLGELKELEFEDFEDEEASSLG